MRFVMNRPRHIETSPLVQPNRAYVQVVDPRTKKSKSFTMQGVTVAQAIRLLRRGIELATKEEDAASSRNVAHSEECAA